MHHGTGSFVLVNTGDKIVRSDAGLLSTVAWKHPDGTLTYALEGAIFVTGSAVQWLRDGLGIIENASETEEMALSVPNSAGVVFVPALTGLGAPIGIPTRVVQFRTHARCDRRPCGPGNSRGDCLEVRDVVDVMVNEADVELPRLTVDGGAAANNFLCQVQTDQVRVPVVRSEILETTGLGRHSSPGSARVLAEQGRAGEVLAVRSHIEPGDRDEQAHRRWRVAVERTKNWATAASK